MLHASITAPVAPLLSLASAAFVLGFSDRRPRRAGRRRRFDRSRRIASLATCGARTARSLWASIYRRLD